MSDILSFSRSVTISDGQTLSSAADLDGRNLVGLFIDSSFTGTSLTVKSATSLLDTYSDFYNASGAEASITVAANRCVGLVPFDMTSIRFIKFEANTAQSGSDTVITLVTKEIV